MKHLIRQLNENLNYELVANRNPEAIGQRRRRIDKLTGAERMTALALHKTIQYCPDTLGALLDRHATSAGVPVLGRGCAMTAYRTEIGVVKLLRKSIYMTEAERDARCEYEVGVQQPALEYLGGVALEQFYFVGQHPFKPKRRVVIATQPLVEGFRPVQFNDLRQEGRRVRQQLGSFANASIEMSDNTGYLPDLEGVDNLGVGGANGALVLVDTSCTPSAKESPVTQERLEMMLNVNGTTYL